MDAVDLRERTSLAPAHAIASYRRFVLSFLCSSLVGLGSLAALNVLVDPFGAFGVTLIPADSRSADSRTARAELLRRFTGETVLIGSSRTRVGYDGHLPGLSGGPACNVGLDGTHLSELSIVVQQAIANRHVKRIVLSIDVHLASAHWKPNSDYRSSRFNPDRTAFSHLLDQLWNGRSTEASVRALRKAWSAEPAMHDELGFARFAGRRFERAEQPERTRAALEQICGESGMLAELQPREESRHQLEQMLQMCRQAEVEVTIVIDPVHCLLLEGMRSTGKWNAYTDWKHDVVDVAERCGVTVWDFTGYSPYTTENLLADDAAESAWFWEPSHMRRELGDLVLQRVLQGIGEVTFGRQVTSANIVKSWQAMETDRQRWLDQHPGEVTQLAKLWTHSLHEGEVGPQSAGPQLASPASTTVTR